MNSQTNYYVAPSGDDSNDGTQINTPWQTIQHAMDLVPPNSIVNIRGGTYNEKVEVNVSGLPNEPIILTSYPNEIVILDGTGIISTEAIISIFDQNHIHIEGLIIQNSIMPDAQGIIVEGTCSGIEIRNNEIRNIHFSNNPNDPVDETKNSQPLVVYGTSGTTPISDLIIELNTIHSSRTGYSEGLAVNGNVANFLIANNLVYDISNIGIDVIGHEGTAPASVDQARQGTISGNIIHHCKSPYATAAGIYVDGGKDLMIEQNVVHNCQWGIEVGCENLNRSTSNIIVVNNLIYENDDACMALGGFDYPNESGKVTNSILTNNTCYNNDLSSVGVGGTTGELFLTYSENCQISNNIFYTKNPGGIMIYQDAVNPLNLSLNYNLYFPQSGYDYEFNGQFNTAFTSYQSSTGQDEHSLNADPQFKNAGGADFNLESNSPAIDSGDPTYDLVQTDFYGTNRIINNRVDIGAIEYYLATQTHILIEQDDISVYPNPVSGQIFIDGNRSFYTLTLLNTSGTLIKLIDEPTPVEIDLGGLPAGTYFLSIDHQNNPKLHFQTIIIE